MKFFAAVILLTVAVAMADKDEDSWNFYKVNTIRLISLFRQ